jgi:regulator of vacuolar morphogenesis
MNRSEANSLPTLFTAPAAAEPPAKASEVTRETENVCNEPQQKAETPEEHPTLVKRPLDGVYSDGVYIGLTLSKSIGDECFSEAQASYYNLLHHRFLLLRSILKCTPPPEAISALDDAHPISFPRHSKNAQREWRRLLLAVDPHMVQLACMDMDTVLGVMIIAGRLMSENVRSGDATLVRRIGAWIWGLLGKCRDSGQLGAQEIGDIRELGKRAIRILQKLRETKEVQDDGEEDGSESDMDMQNDENVQIAESERVVEDQGAAQSLDQPSAERATDAEELERAKARLEARVQAAGIGSTSQIIGGEDGETEEEAIGADVETQTRVMLDMIITIVGEHYGQRDLLEAREIWTDVEQRLM